MQPIIGQSATRQDARLKVTGAAKYCAEFALPNLAYAVLVTAPVGLGTIRALDVAEARAATGVIEVISHFDTPRYAALTPDAIRAAGANPGEFVLPLSSPEITYNGQAIAVVVADTYERARYAATLVVADIEARAPATTLYDTDDISRPEEVTYEAAQTTRGAPDAALANAEDARLIEATYRTPTEHHHPIEPHAIVASWQGDDLTAYLSSQGVTRPQGLLAVIFEVPKERVRVVCHFTGGGFGSKGIGIWPHEILCVLAARRVGRPVKLVLTRQQMFAGVGHRGECEMTLQIATDATGQMEVLQHATRTQGHELQPKFFESAGFASRHLYAAPNFEMTHVLANNNISPPSYMRAPGESPGVYALESAMDEMAHQLGLDPIAFRLKNYAQTDPHSGLPWSSKHLKECYQRGAALIGWSNRQKEPRQLREGRYQIGYGMASATYPGLRRSASAQCRIYADGRAVAGSAGCDIGTGAYTVFRQVAADTLGFPLYKVVFELGDTRLPFAPVAAGSWLTASVAPAVAQACHKAMSAVAALAIKDRKSPLFGRKLSEIRFRDGLAVLANDGTKGEALSQIIRRSGQPFVEACSKAETMESAARASKAPNDEGLKQRRRAPCEPVAPDSFTGMDEEKYAFHSWGAQCCKLRVDEEMGTVRLLDCAVVVDCGRILNPMTARSQVLGGVGFAIGMALCEETRYDPKTARPVPRNLADYHVPTNADVPRIQVEFVNAPDPHISVLGGRGVGQIGAVGVPAAIANAVFNATGRRLRDLPLTPDKFV